MAKFPIRWPTVLAGLILSVAMGATSSPTKEHFLEQRAQWWAGGKMGSFEWKGATTLPTKAHFTGSKVTLGISS